MERVIEMIRKELSTVLNSKIDEPNLFDQFLLALSLGDHNLAAEYFAASVEARWEPPVDAGDEAEALEQDKVDRDET
jgi:hypothetical protein